MKVRLNNGASHKVSKLTLNVKKKDLGMHVRALIIRLGF